MNTFVNATHPSDALMRDLSLVGDYVPCRATGATWRERVSARVGGKSVELERAVEKLKDLLKHSRAPAMVGLHMLSIEALRETVRWAESVSGRLQPWPVIASPLAQRRPVTMTATLGEVFASDLVIWVGREGYEEDHPVARAIAEKQLLAAFVGCDAQTVLGCRATFENDPTAEPVGRHRRVAVVLPPGCEETVASQWHALAARLQQFVRVCVFQIPGINAMNARGVAEVLTWQTGVYPATGIDFSGGAPRACSDAQTLLDLHAIDLLIEVGKPTEQGHRSWAGPLPGARVTIGHTPAHDGKDDLDAALSITLPGLFPVAARMMRCDGVVLWLCDDPATAPPDPLAELLRYLCDQTATT
ncbi:MAG: hypothetical protein GC164_13085 [Phycisphaera sp.]|nr:hypothetical protein [Phycisphaera sp.]